MLRRSFVLALTLTLLLPIAAGADDAGVNHTIDVTDSPINSITAPSVSTDGADFIITLTLMDDAKNNGTTVQWTVQQCINSGVCNPPEKLNLTESNGVWSDTITPVDTHSYINYDIVLTYPDSNVTEKFPEQGFSQGGKVWSDCWVSGEDRGGENCPEVISKDNGLPAPGLLTGIAATLGAAMLAKRED